MKGAFGNEGALRFFMIGKNPGTFLLPVEPYSRKAGRKFHGSR
jgi:hypothetical protein